MDAMTTTTLTEAAEPVILFIMEDDDALRDFVRARFQGQDYELYPASPPNELAVGGQSGRMDIILIDVSGFAQPADMLERAARIAALKSLGEIMAHWPDTELILTQSDRNPPTFACQRSNPSPELLDGVYNLAARAAWRGTLSALGWFRDEGALPQHGLEVKETEVCHPC